MVGGADPELFIGVAREVEASAIAALRNAVAGDLTVRHGPGHWSSVATERGVLRAIQGTAHTSRVLVAREGARLVGTLRLVTKKPWAIDRTCFVAVPRPLYLHDMAVAPELQGRGIGRRLLDEAQVIARGWPANSIRLDAYDGPAGAGAFYAWCGYREVGRAVYRGVPLIYYELML